nr:ribonuclease H-like domain-containing protein [Tanacetum cinerariifolium]
AVATACYVLNRVLVTKPHDKTPYELLIRDKPSISYLNPFGCYVTILNTSNPLGKFDKKSDEDNLDELTELQALQRQEQAETEEADRLRLAFPSLNPILGVGSASISSSISAGSTPPVSAGSTPPMSPCASPISVDRHSISAGKSYVSADRPTGSAGRPVSAGRSSGSADRTPVPAGRILGKFIASTSSEQFPRASSMENSDIHDGLKIFDCPKFGIFTSSSYDEEFFGPDANNLESSLDVSSTITKRIHNIHPTSQVLGDINSPVQTRRQNKRDARGIVYRNKARLVAQGHRQEEGVDYTDVFAHLARIEAIRLFLAFA